MLAWGDLDLDRRLLNAPDRANETTKAPSGLSNVILLRRIVDFRLQISCIVFQIFHIDPTLQYPIIPETLDRKAWGEGISSIGWSTFEFEYEPRFTTPWLIVLGTQINFYSNHHSFSTKPKSKRERPKTNGHKSAAHPAIEDNPASSSPQKIKLIPYFRALFQLLSKRVSRLSGLDPRFFKMWFVLLGSRII